MPKYARGKLAYGFCDRCGQRYPISELNYQIIDGFRSNLLVCRHDMDIDHEQLRTETVRTDDAIDLKDPRPDLSLEESRAFSGFNPIVDSTLRVSTGTVTVTTT